MTLVRHLCRTRGSHHESEVANPRAFNVNLPINRKTSPLYSQITEMPVNRQSLTSISRGNFKRYPEIGDPQQGSIEPLKKFYRTPKKVLSNPKGYTEPPPLFWAPKRFYRTLEGGTSDPQTGFYRTFCIETPLFRLPF